MSDVDDDVLEQTGEQFGAKYGESGFGTSEVMRELLSRDPTYVPIKDLAAYQQSLKDTGYLPDSYAPVGQVDDSFLAADRRASRDAFKTSMGGGNWMAAGPQTLFRYLGYTVPTSVFDGMYGIAQGIVSDAARAVTNPVEVLEEGGAAGGAAVGAGIGAAVGTFILPGAATAAGAVVGGIIGGVAGFFGDLFDDDEEEEGNWQKVVGALSPIDEIKSGDAKNLFAALSTIMAASTILKSGQLAVAGVRAAGGAGQIVTREGWRMAARSDVSPGLLNQITQAGLKHRTLGTSALAGTANAAHELVTTGDAGQALRDFGTGAVLGFGVSKLGRAVTGGKTVAKGADALIGQLDKAPLMRIAMSPGGKAATSIYTGLSAPTIVARGIGELGQTQVGVDEQGEPIYESGTAIGRDIEEADFRERLGTAGTIIDWTVGAAIFPNRLLPWKAADVAAGMKTMSSNHVLLPFAMFNRTKAGGKTIGLGKSFDEIVEVMGPDPVTLGARATDTYMQIATEARAHTAVKERLAALPAPKDVFDVAKRDEMEARWLMEERSKIKGQVLQEAEAAGKTGDIAATETGQTLLQEGLATEATAVVNFMRTKGFDLSAWKGHQEATEYLSRRRVQLQEEGFRYTPAVKGEYLVAQDFEDFTETYRATATRYVSARKLYSDLSAEIPTDQLQTAVRESGKELDDVLGQMKDRGVINEDIYNSLRPGQGEPKVSDKLIDYLERNASWRPRRDDDLTAELENIAGGRYMAVKTGENMINTSHFLDQAEISGIKEYTHRQNFFDAVSSFGAKVDKADLGKMRYNSIVSHVDQSIGRWAEGLDGKQATDKIYDYVKARYDETAAKRRGERIDVKWGGVIKIEDAYGKTRREFFKIDPRDLDADDIVEALDLHNKVKPGVDVYEAADRIKRSMHVGAAFGADIAHPLRTMRSLGAALRVNGAPAFNDWVRTANFMPAQMGNKTPGRFKRGSYGYLPQHIRRVHMGIQFSLNPTFDASRYAEAIMFGKFRGGDLPIKATTSPKRFVKEFEEGWTSPFTGQEVRGEEAVKEMIRFGDSVLYGRAMNQNFDELQLRLLNAGPLGFKPREVEYAQAWWLGQKKAGKGPLKQSDLEEIRETVMQIGQYGTKQTAFGNTMHFVFFPFLFSRKQLGATVDFMLGAPTRNLLIHEGLRRWYQETGEDGTSMSDTFRDIIEKHAPILGEVGRLNNLAYGVSAGRFFLEGIIDKPTEGKIAQAVTSFLAPGGVHSPVGQAVGDAFTLGKNAFIPQIWTGNSIEAAGGLEGALALVEKLVPVYRDFDRYFVDDDSGSEFGAVGAQFQAFGGRGTARGQMGDYLDAKRVMGQALDTVATEAGYASWDSLRGSRPELGAAVNEIEGTLGAEFPDGMRLAQEFTNKEGIKEQTLYDIEHKDGAKTKAEEAISFLGQLEAQAYLAGAQGGISQEKIRALIAPVVRQYALGYFDDRQFMNLWDGLFRNTFGSLRQIKVA